MWLGYLLEKVRVLRADGSSTHVVCLDKRTLSQEYDIVRNPPTTTVWM